MTCVDKYILDQEFAKLEFGSLQVGHQGQVAVTVQQAVGLVLRKGVVVLSPTLGPMK